MQMLQRLFGRKQERKDERAVATVAPAASAAVSAAQPEAAASDYRVANGFQLPEGWLGVKDPCMDFQKFRDAKDLPSVSFGGGNWKPDPDLETELARYGVRVFPLFSSHPYYVATQFIAGELHNQVWGRMPVTPYRLTSSLEHVLAALARETQQSNSPFGLMNSPNTLYTIQGAKHNREGVLIVQHTDVLASEMPKTAIDAHKLLTEGPNRKVIGVISTIFWEHSGDRVYYRDVMPFLKVSTTGLDINYYTQHHGGCRYLPIVGFRDAGKTLSEVVMQEEPSTPLSRGYEPWEGELRFQDYLKGVHGKPLLLATNANKDRVIGEAMKELSIVIQNPNNWHDQVYTPGGQPIAFGGLRVGNVGWPLGGLDSELELQGLHPAIGNSHYGSERHNTELIYCSPELGRHHVLAVVGLLNEQGAAVKLYVPEIGHFVPVNNANNAVP